MVKEFIQLTDVKQTIEKEVRQKPSIDQLTTVESPGKPIAADIIENNESMPKKKSKTKVKAVKPKAKAEKIATKRDATLIITEKPQAAQKIANALGNPRKYTDSGVSYYEIEKDGKKIIVASAVGHLFGLDYKKGQKGWPIFDLEWKPSYEKGGASAFTKKYYELLKTLAKRTETFIIATDYDIEGEVIGWNVLRFLCGQKNALRMKFSTLTADELLASFENPQKELNWGNAYAGESRHIIDWLYGINLSRALMSAIKTSGSFRILSIGRVQGPALKIIVDREKEIQNFKPVPFWQIFADIDWDDLNIPKHDILFKHPKDIFDKKELDKFNNIKEATALTDKAEKFTSPPEPFDLTTLQREAYRLYKMSPSETLSIAQKLYLDGIISYPRTSSQKIPDAIEPKKILKKLAKNFTEVKFATRSKPVEGKKSDPAHPSIYPTGEVRTLEDRPNKLYQLIVKRFISCFCQDLKTDYKKITLTTKDNLDFTASGSTIIDKGWLNVYPSEFEESNIPDINGNVKIKEIKIEQKETQPPSRFSPTSLITLLEKKNLGTKSTRSMIVDTLFERGYLDGKSITATPLGLKLIEALEKYSSIIIDENLTRQLEESMENIQESTSDFEDKEKNVIEKAKIIITDISKEFKSKEKEIGEVLKEGLLDLRKEQQEANTLIQCPTCKKGNLRIMFNRASRRYFIACSAYPECKQTYSLPPNALIKKSEKVCPADQFPKLLAIRKGKRPWEFCFNPDCPIEKEKKAAWAAKKEAKESSSKA